MSVYLDHNATTRAAPAVVSAVVEMMSDGFGNPASSHIRGRSAQARVDEAREQVARLLAVAPGRIVWTSGSTEALNTALLAATASHPHLLVSKAEHKAVLDTATFLERRGVPVTWLEVDADGVVQPTSLREALPDAPFTLAAMAANNETGVLNDMRALTELAHDSGGVVVCDATQQAGKVPVDLQAWDVDFAAVSAHKLHGPQGVGAMIVPSGQTARPLIHGGGHQRGWRSGTLNAAGIVGFGVAAELAAAGLSSSPKRVETLRDELLELLVAGLGALPVNGQGAERLPNTLNVRVLGADSDALVINCPTVAFSSGSACTAAVPTPSHVLTAMGLSAQHADESIRLSLGSDTTVEDIKEAADALISAATRIRELDGWSG